jgi:hypothetical protein
MLRERIVARSQKLARPYVSSQRKNLIAIRPITLCEWLAHTYQEDGMDETNKELSGFELLPIPQELLIDEQTGKLGERKIQVAFQLWGLSNVPKLGTFEV